MSLEDEEAALTPELTGLASSIRVWQLATGHTLHLWLPYQFHCTVLLWKQGHNNVPGTGQVNWNHILFAVNIVIKCSEDMC